jgi:hypothetical protein
VDFKLFGWGNFFWEARPFFYLAVGIYTLSVDHPSLLLVSLALIMIFCAIGVMRMRYYSRRGANMDSLFYESLPFLYVTLGVYAILFQFSSKLAISSGVILLLCATRVFQMRIKNRKAAATFYDEPRPELNIQIPTNKDDLPIPPKTNASGK